MYKTDYYGIAETKKVQENHMVPELYIVLQWSSQEWESQIVPKTSTSRPQDNAYNCKF